MNDHPNALIKKDTEHTRFVTSTFYKGQSFKTGATYKCAECCREIDPPKDEVEKV